MLATSTKAVTADSARQPFWRSRPVWAVVWVIGVYVLCPPQLAIGVGGDPLTSSFTAALEQGLGGGLHWGSQIVWTYGPYGALDSNLGVEPRILVAALAVRLLTHAVLVALLAAVLWYRKVRPLFWVVSGLCFFAFSAAGPLELNIECVLVAVLASLLAFSGGPTLALRWRLALMSLAGIALALASLDKTSDTVDSVGILVILTIHSVLIRRHLRVVAAGWVTWLTGGLLLWTLAGQRLQDIPAFTRTAVELIDGYASAMAIGATTWVTVVAALIVVSLLGLAIIFTVRRRSELALATALATVVEFLLFKEGFIRADSIHVDWFLVPSVYMLVVLAAIAPTSRIITTAAREQRAAPRHRDRSAVALASAAGVAVVTLLIAAAADQLFVVSHLTNPVTGYGGALASIFSPAQRDAVRARDLSDLASMYAIPPTLLAKVRGRTVDVLPLFDVAPLVYGLAGTRQPVLQSYSAYTSYLDALDAAFFAGPNAPDFIVIAYQPIDSRLLQFDEPLVLRVLLDNYRVDPVSSSGYVLLDRHPPLTPPPTTLRGDDCVWLGQPVTVPQVPGARVYAHVRVSLSALGVVTGLLYRPGLLYITVTTVDQADHLGAPQTRTFRFVSGTAPDGLLVSGLATDTQGLAQLLAGTTRAAAITTFRITTDSPAQYDQRMCVGFESTTAR